MHANVQVRVIAYSHTMLSVLAFTVASCPLLRPPSHSHGVGVPSLGCFSLIFSLSRCSRMAHLSFRASFVHGATTVATWRATQSLAPCSQHSSPLPPRPFALLFESPCLDARFVAPIIRVWQTTSREDARKATVKCKYKCETRCSLKFKCPCVCVCYMRVIIFGGGIICWRCR